MTLGLAVFLAGLFGVPLVLLRSSHGLRKRSPRFRSIFWGAVIGHCVAGCLAVILGMIPPESWTREETMRGFAGLWAFIAAGSLAYAQQRASLRPLIGDWSVIEDEGPALEVDGAAWDGQTSEIDLRASARALFPGVEESFVTHGMAPTAFPLAVWTDSGGFAEGTIRVRFKLLGGASDQNAGIVIGLQPGGNYHFVRYNTKDGNLAVWTWASGERKVLAHGETHLQLPLGTWQELVVTVAGTQVTGSVTGTSLTVEHKLESPAAGRIGLWTKRDAITAFRDFSVKPGAP